MAKRSGGKKGPKAEQLREVGEKAKDGIERPAIEPGQWVEIMVGTARTVKPAWALKVEGLGDRTLVQVTWPNQWAHDPEDDRAAWTEPKWVFYKREVVSVGLSAMGYERVEYLWAVLKACGLPEGAEPGVDGLAVQEEWKARGGQVGSVAEAAVEAVREHGQPREGDEDQDSCTVSVNGGEPVATNLDGMKRTAEALEAKAGEGTKPGDTVHVEFDRPIGRLVGEHADLQGVRLLHDPKTEEAWALASNGAVMAAMPVMMTLPELGAAPAEADVVPGEAAMGKAGKPRALELRAGRPQGLFDTGVAWVSSLENRWWGTWKPTRACWMADALPNVPANGQGVVAVRLRAEQLADLAKVVGDEQGGVTLLLDVAELGKAQPGVEGEKAKVRVGVVGENETGVGAPVGVLMMEVQGSGACKRYSESHGRLLRLTAAPRNQLTGKMD